MRKSHTVSCIYGRMYKKMCVTGFHNACDGRVNKDRQRSACCLGSRKLLVGCPTEPGRFPPLFSLLTRQGGEEGSQDPGVICGGAYVILYPAKGAPPPLVSVYECVLVLMSSKERNRGH